MDSRTIVVLEGDETGQELLEEALRTLAPDVIGFELEFPRFDLSLAHRREAHRGFFTGTDGSGFHDAMDVVLERFRVVYRAD